MSLFGVDMEGPSQLLRTVEPLWERGLADLPEPHHPFLVSNLATPGAGQMTEEMFFEAVTRSVSEIGPHGIALTSEIEVGLALKLLGLVADGLRPLCPLEAVIRKVLGVDPHDPLDPKKQAERLAQVLAGQIEIWHDLNVDEESYTPDAVKQTLLVGSVMATLAANILQAMTSVPTEGPPYSSPSSGAIGRHVHRFVQMAYVAAHPTNHVICDGRWYYLAFSVTLSHLIGSLTAPEIAAYTAKIIAFRNAMQNPGGTPVRPDIADLDADTAYEIKPRAGAHAAFHELHRFYIPRYHDFAILAGLPDLNGGLWMPPPLYFDPQEQVIALIKNEGLGAIIYDVFRIPEEALSALLGFLLTIALLNTVLKKISELHFPLPPPPPVLAEELAEFRQKVQQFADFIYQLALVMILIIILAIALAVILARSPVPA